MNISLPEPSTILTLVGALLLLTGVLGGGFEVKEVRIPKIGGFGRVASLSVGLLFLLAGVGMDAETPPGGPTGNFTVPAPAPLPAVTPRAPEPVDFLVFDELGDSQISEQVTLILDGKPFGTLTVDEHHPESNMRVTVPGRGKYSYTVDAEAVFDIDDAEVRHRGTGQGMINVERGKEFELQGSMSGTTWNVVLVERR